MAPRDEEAELPAWDDVAEYTDWTGLLVGNGASMVVWPQFGYRSLFEIASSAEIAHPLESDDRNLFDALDTTNFEQVLASLKTAAIVNSALEIDANVIQERYESTQRALFDSVHAVHVPWDYVARRTIPALFKALRDYTFVYSTNYDLLLYWASMENGGKGFLDYFWGGGSTFFDGADTDIWTIRERWTRILFLHGGIHLRRLRDAGTRKARADEGAILEQFSTEFDGLESPLLISEGDSVDKLGSIRSSDYLTFAHQQFSTHEGGLVVFGHSLSRQDDHLVTPMKNWRGSPIAIAIRPNDDDDVIVQQKDRFRSRLSPNKDIVFFDSTTHPLGDTGLAAREPKGLFGRR
jgi:hypothetical protein